MEDTPQPGKHVYTAKLTLGAKGGSKPAPKVSLQRKIAGIVLFVVVVIIFGYTASQVGNQIKPPASPAGRYGQNTIDPDTGLPMDDFVQVPGSTLVPNVLVEEINGQVFLGIRAVLEADVWRVDWNEKTVVLRAEKYNHPSIEFHAHSTTVIIGDDTEQLKTAPIVRQRRLLVPVEWLMKFTDGRVTYDQVRKKTYLFKNKEDANLAPTSSPETPIEPEPKDGDADDAAKAPAPATSP